MMYGSISQKLRDVLTFLFLAAFFWYPAGLSATENTILPYSPPAGVTLLPPVSVTGTFSNPATGRSVMEGTVIRKMPAGNGSINEILRAFPDVQTAERFRTASDAAEILPPPISISGGKTFENSFRIDGLRNDSLLDPASTEVQGFNEVQGHPQALFLDAALVDKLIVYDSSIPARHGGFTGGVVEVETRGPRPLAGGELFYRTTRADWTRFHLVEGETEPADYEKHLGGVEFDIPLRPDMGVLASYRQIYSRIPKRHLGNPHTQMRRKEDYFLKYAWALPEGNLDVSFASTPYEGELFIPNAKNSNFIVRQGGTQIQARVSRFLPMGELRVQGGYQSSRNTREAPSNMLAWEITDARPWGGPIGFGVSNEGGFGDLEKTQESFSVRSSLNFETLRTGTLTHTPEVGVELETIGGKFRRKETVYIYSEAETAAVICGEDTVACIDDDQYFIERMVHPESSVSARMNLADLYLEDEIRYGRLTVRPGARFSYDDFMENFNTSPRLATTFDLFGSGQTVLMAGASRYYGRSLLTYKLKEGQLPPSKEYRGIEGGFPNEWERVNRNLVDAHQFSKLDTPYSDEVTAGIDQALAGGRLSLRYVHRENKDEFAREFGATTDKGQRVFTLNNRGRSRHQSARLTWERSWARHFVSCNVTWQETESSNESYEDILNDEEVEEQVWFNGRIVQKTELPRIEYNRPWTVNLTYTGDLPHGFSFTNVARYRSGFKGIVDTRTPRAVPGGEARRNPLTGEIIEESLPVYEKRNLSGGVVFDWALRWQSPGRRPLQLSLEIDNVFNSRLETGFIRSTYETGRQFWTSASWKF